MVPSSQGQTGMITSSSGFHFDLQWGQTRQKIGKKKVEKITIPRVLSEMASVQNQRIRLLELEK